ncbi:MAG TPA: hypothetical protein VH302_04260 [Bryobacteraceae bacterium]|nr:hypothetical protein [Bryobacteraceae bacterium]
MTASTAKRSILYRFDRQPFEVLVSAGTYLYEQEIECITPDGLLHRVPFDQVKALCFFSEPGSADLFTAHRLFERRPKVPGLWTRFTFKDGDLLDGILSHNLLEWPLAGYLITPPRAGSARQRVFIPRTAVMGTELRGVVGRSAVASRQRTQQPQGELDDARAQLRMFD